MDLTVLYFVLAAFCANNLDVNELLITEFHRINFENRHLKCNFNDNSCCDFFYLKNPIIRYIENDKIGIGFDKNQKIHGKEICEFCYIQATELFNLYQFLNCTNRKIFKIQTNFGKEDNKFTIFYSLDKNNSVEFLFHTDIYKIFIVVIDQDGRLLKNTEFTCEYIGNRGFYEMEYMFRNSSKIGSLYSNTRTDMILNLKNLENEILNLGSKHTEFSVIDYDYSRGVGDILSFNSWYSGYSDKCCDLCEYPTFSKFWIKEKENNFSVFIIRTLKKYLNKDKTVCKSCFNYAKLLFEDREGLSKRFIDFASVEISLKNTKNLESFGFLTLVSSISTNETAISKYSASSEFLILNYGKFGAKLLDLKNPTEILDFQKNLIFILLPKDLVEEKLNEIFEFKTHFLSCTNS